jgi:hypothetical protein
VNVLTELFRRLDIRRAHLEVEQELQFHLDLLTDELCQQNMSWDQAQANALGRFGDFNQIRNECVRIARRHHPLVSALKWFFGFVFITGVLVRIFGSEFHVVRVGNILMAVGVLSRLLLYLRVMTPFVSKPDESMLIKLTDAQLSLAAYDQETRTPVERVISYK